MDLQHSLHIIQNATANSVVTESNALSVAEQMILREYTGSTKKPKSQPVLAKYVEDINRQHSKQIEESKDKHAKLARRIAEKIMQESKLHPTSAKSSKLASKVAEASHCSLSQIFESDAETCITLNSQLLMSVLEYSKDDATSVAELHSIVEQITSLSTEHSVLTMQHYESIIGKQKLLPKK